MGLAVAGTMAAVEAGASHVQGTLLGVGERCGNAELSSLIPNLELKLGIGTIGREKLKSLYSVCRRVAQISNMSVWKGKPYVGNSAFAHKGGMHIDAVMKNSESFEHIPPDAVGNERRYLFSNVSGRAAALFAARKVEPSLTKDDPAVSRLIEKIKKLEDSGYRFEAAEASLDLLVRKELGRYKDFFSLESFDIEENYALGVCASTADITISVDGEKKTASATGIGPVHALDKAIREAVAAEFPRLAAVHLVDYKVRVMTPESATAATVAVLIDSTDGSRNWSTVAASVDVIQASANALADAYDYYLQLYGKEL